jgi:glycosyltransferase involved in cell wall biosynthesis
MVHFKGFKKNPYHYMKNALAFVLSSKWEGFGHVLVEALACECPVISTDCNFGPAEILDNGRFGKLISVVDPLTLADGINATLSLEKEEKQEITARGKERAGNYSVEKIVESYELLFSKLCRNQ